MPGGDGVKMEAASITRYWITLLQMVISPDGHDEATNVPARKTQTDRPHECVKLSWS
jgi:hypothetical protein